MPAPVSSYDSYGCNYYGYDLNGNTCPAQSNPAPPLNVVINGNTKLATDLLAFWSTYLVYSDDDFATYMYNFPTFVKQ